MNWKMEIEIDWEWLNSMELIIEIRINYQYGNIYGAHIHCTHNRWWLVVFFFDWPLIKTIRSYNSTVNCCNKKCVNEVNYVSNYLIWHESVHWLYICFSAAFLTKSVTLDTVVYKYQIWDTAGQEKVRVYYSWSFHSLFWRLQNITLTPRLDSVLILSLPTLFT